MRLNQKGDTIVEVLIALAIIGMVLGGAFATADRSIRVMRQSQERTEAVKVAENQLEIIKARASIVDPEPGSNVFIDDNDFCIATDGTVSTFDLGFVLTPYNELPPDSDFDGYPLECEALDRYFSHVSYDGDNYDRFTITVRWLRLGGDIDQVQVVQGASPFAAIIFEDIEPSPDPDNPDAPSTPQNLSGTFIDHSGVDPSATEINLRWDASSGGAGGTLTYRVYRSNGDFVETVDTSRLFLVYDEGAGMPPTITYEVEAFDSEGNTSAQATLVFQCSGSAQDGTADCSEEAP
ncbi:hypothetical protein BH23PAT2_BH23PAT2_03200 [soil metagenome]